MTRGEAVAEMRWRMKRAWLGLSAKVPDGLVCATALDTTITSLINREEWDWAIAYGKVADLVSGQRETPLPNDFGVNFLRAEREDDLTGLSGKFAVYLTDSSSNDHDLTYKRPTRLLRVKRSGQSNDLPKDYTIQWTPSGKFMIVDPPADGSYTVTGAYKRTWDRRYVSDETEIPLPVPHAAVWEALLQFEPENQDWRLRAQQEMRSLYSQDKEMTYLGVETDTERQTWDVGY